MNKLRSLINCESLELELWEAVRADELYRLQNDAKLRAVEQNVPTYEDFRQMVNAAHLKPVKRHDEKPNINRAWNPIAAGDSLNSIMFVDGLKVMQKSDNVLQFVNENSNTLDVEATTSYEQFIRVWRALNGHEAKFRCLKVLRHNLQENVFRTEIPPALLVEFLTTCRQSVSLKDNIESVIDILHTLSNCNRFRLAVCFMRQKEKDMCAGLFRDLLIAAEHQDNIATDAVTALALLYEVEIKGNRTENFRSVANVEFEHCHQPVQACVLTICRPRDILVFNMAAWTTISPVRGIAITDDRITFTLKIYRNSFKQLCTSFNLQ